MKALVIVGIVVVALLVVGGAAVLLLFRGKDLSRYQALRAEPPHIEAEGHADDRGLLPGEAQDRC